MRILLSALLITACFSTGSQTASLRAQPDQRQITPVADHHQHLFSSNIRSLLAAESIEFPVVTAQDVVKNLDSAGIQQALVLSAAYMYGSSDWTVENEYAKVRAENDWTAAQVSEHSKRLRAFCSFNPLRNYALRELERCGKDLQLPGIKLHFANSGVNLSDSAHVKQLRRVFRAANEQKMAVVIHLRASIDPPRPYGSAQGGVFLKELLPLVPDVPVQIAHLAGTGPGYDDPPAHAVMSVLVTAIEKNDPRADRLWFDVAGLVSPDVSSTDAERIARWIRRAGIERVLYGSDASVGANSRPQERWTAFRQLPLTEDELARIADNVAPYLR